MISVILKVQANTISERCAKSILSQSLPLEDLEVLALGNSQVVPAVQTMLGGVCASLYPYDDRKELPQALLRAINQAKGELIFFTDSTCKLSTNCLSHHLSAHEHLSAGRAYFGKLDYDESQAENIFAYACRRNDFHFPHNSIIEDVPYGYEYFPTRNLSIARASLLNAEVLPSPIHDSEQASDFELGYRLWMSGVRAYYLELASACTKVNLSTTGILDELRGQASGLFSFIRLHPELLPYYYPTERLIMQDIAAWAHLHKEDAANLENVAQQMQSVETLSSKDTTLEQQKDLVESISLAFFQISQHFRREAVLQYFVEHHGNDPAFAADGAREIPFYTKPRNRSLFSSGQAKDCRPAA